MGEGIDQRLRAAFVAVGVKHDLGRQIEMPERGIGPGQRRHLFAGVGDKAGALRTSGSLTARWPASCRMIARMRELGFVDPDRTVRDFEARQKSFAGQLGFTHVDADAANEAASFRSADWRTFYAAFGSAALASAKAQSSQGVSASTSLVSTVAPHQMRRPGGASR